MRWETARELSGEFWTFFVASLFVALSFSMYVFLYSLFLLDIGFNEKQIGLVAGAMTFGIMAATLPIGALARRFGVRRVMMTGFVLTSVVCVTRLYVSSEHAQIALAFVMGLAMCHWQVCYSPAIAALTVEKNRTFAFSLLMSFGIAVGAVGGLLGGTLPGWVEKFYPLLHSVEAKRAVLLLCVAIYAMALWPVSRLKLHAVDRRQRTPWRLDPFLARFLPVIALWSLTAGAFVPFANVFFARRVHLSLAHIGVTYAATELVQVVSILAAPVVFRRCGLIAGLAYAQVLTAVSLAGLAWTHRVPSVIGMYLAFSAFHWMGEPGLYSLLMNRVAESERSSASAANSFVIALCQGGAAAAAGAAYVDFGYPAVLCVVAVVALATSGLFWVLLRESPHQSRAEAVIEAEC